MTNIGFVGLGHMGLPMAINLVKAGFNIEGFDLSQEALKHFSEAGGKAVASLDELAANKDILITMLQTGEQVLAVTCNAEGLFAKAKKGTLFIDCSSINVEQSREVHREAHQFGLLPLDAPVSGGTKGAANATLTFMVGGEETTFNMAKPILSHLGKNIIHTGQAGSGQAAKICNNMILGISMIAVSEAFVLAEELGLSADKLFSVVNSSSGQCWALSQYVPVPNILPNVPANQDYKPGFTAAMMLKDLGLTAKASEKVNLTMPMANQALHLYQQFVKEGFGELDFSGIIKSIQPNKINHD